MTTELDQVYLFLRSPGEATDALICQGDSAMDLDACLEQATAVLQAVA